MRRATTPLLLALLAIGGCRDDQLSTFPAGDEPQFVEVAIPPVLVEWQFENPVSASGRSTFAGSALTSWVTGSASQVCGGPAEDFGAPYDYVHLTRFFGESDCYPYVDITATRYVRFTGVNYHHLHNHNPGYPTYPSYNVQAQIRVGSSYQDFGAQVLLSSATSSMAAWTTADLVLPPGTYRIRWLPRGLAWGANTNTEYFAIDDLRVHGYALNAFQLLDYLGSIVAGLGGTLSRGELNALNASLLAAEESANLDDMITAANQVGAFGNKVGALVRSGRLDAATGESLINLANAVLGLMSS